MSQLEKIPSSAPGEPQEELTPEAVAREVGGDVRESTVINKLRTFINSRVEESRLPTKEGLGYESTMGIYGGKLVRDEQNHLVYDTRGFWSKVDVFGDRVLRSFDEHHARKPGAMFLRRPGAFLKMLPFLVDSKRYRGTLEQAMENVHRLGLDDYYGKHAWGVEIKNPEQFSRLIGLQDIFRQDEINHPAINEIDRFEALGKAAEYMRTLHRGPGAIAEGNVYSFLFSETDGKNVAKPLIMIPTEIYNPEKHISDIEKKATDLLDLFASAATEEYRRSQDWDNVRKAFDEILGHYQDTEVIAMVASYVRRGRLTLPGDTEGLEFETSPTYRIARHGFAAHNTQRLSVKNPEVAPRIRSEIIDACLKYASMHAEKQPS